MTRTEMRDHLIELPALIANADREHMRATADLEAALQVAAALPLMDRIAAAAPDRDTAHRALIVFQQRVREYDALLAIVRAEGGTG